jgi:hypothetical protein
VVRPLLLIEKIKENINFKPFAKLKDWNEFVVSTPAHTFFNYFSMKIVSDYVVMTIVRDKKDDFLLDSFLKQVSNIDFGIPKDFVKKSGMTFPNTSMDGFILLPYQYHNEFKTIDEELHKKTIVILPIHHSEFRGDETVDEVNIIRRDFITTIDWTRDITPQVKMRFKNFKSTTGSVGNKLGFAKLKDISSELSKLNNLKDKQSFIELENYKNEFIRIELNNQKEIEISDLNKEKKFIGDKITSFSFIKNFLTN